MKFQRIYLIAELKKIKSSFALWLAILGAGFIPLFMLLVYINKWKHMVPKLGENPWQVLSNIAWKGNSFMFIPFVIVLMSCLLQNIEHKNNTWRLLFTMPISKGVIFINKFLVLIILIILFYLLFTVFALGVGLVVGIILPQMKFLDYSPRIGEFSLLAFKSFLSSLSILAIHFWLSIRIKNMIIPIGIACACFVVFFALFQAHWDDIIYFPYAFNYLSIAEVNFEKDVRYGIFFKHEVISIIYFISVSVISYFDFTKKYTAK